MGLIREMTVPAETAKRVLKHSLGDTYAAMIDAFVDEVFPKQWRLSCTKVQMIGWCKDAVEFLPQLAAQEAAEGKAKRNSMN